MDASKLPFTLYDFFGYLACGAVAAAAYDYVWFSGAHLQSLPSLPKAVVAIIGVYVLGHVLSHFSRILFQDLPEHIKYIRSRWRPHEVLLGDRHFRVLSVLCSERYGPLPRLVQRLIEHRLEADGLSLPADNQASIIYCQALVTADPTASGRVQQFQNLYGFCRSMSFTLLLVSVVTLGPGGRLSALLPAPWGFVFPFVGFLVLLARFLKFRLIFWREILSWCAASSRRSGG